MPLKGMRVLVVEDEFLVALGLEDNLRALGCIVVGPAGSLAAAMQAAAHETLDVAILDINLAGERVFPAAAILLDRGIPFLFCSGQMMAGQAMMGQMPERFLDAPRVAKPYTGDIIASALVDLMGAELERTDPSAALVAASTTANHH